VQDGRINAQPRSTPNEAKTQDTLRMTEGHLQSNRTTHGMPNYHGSIEPKLRHELQDILHVVFYAVVSNAVRPPMARQVHGENALFVKSPDLRRPIQVMASGTVNQ
jgi:hypothetical protein